MSEVLLTLYGQGTTGTENALASIDIPEDGVIKGIDWAVSADMDADGELSYTELSFIATNQATTNDVRGIISAVRMKAALVTSGMIVSAVNKFVPMDLSVAGGERLYLNVVATSGVTTDINCTVHFVPAQGRPRRSARRRSN